MGWFGVRIWKRSPDGSRRGNDFGQVVAIGVGGVKLLGREGSLPMVKSKLRVYYGPEDSASAAVMSAKVERNTVTVPLGEIFPLLADAVRSERTWLGDFEDDEITISTDLYEVILAYSHYRRPSA